MYTPKDHLPPVKSQHSGFLLDNFQSVLTYDLHVFFLLIKRSIFLIIKILITHERKEQYVEYLITNILGLQSRISELYLTLIGRLNQF